MTDIEWLTNLLAYWTLHEVPRSPYIYPTHKNEDDKRLLRNKRARLKRARAKAIESLKGLK